MCTIIELKDITKLYRSYRTPQHRLLEILSRGKKQYARETRALDGVSLTLKKGGRLGIVGENGSGKSTLLKVLAGVLSPTSGYVQVSGRVSALLELGAGFNPELSGMENIRQFCMLHGMQSEDTEEAIPEIVDFSELKDAINHPVKTYSSGMAIRLGFSSAVYVKPDILIVDEALSVGDAYFQNKCLHKIKSLLDRGTSFIYVTHAADSVRSLCDQGIWMEHGRVRLAGTASEVGSAYQAEVYRRMAHTGITDADDADAPLDVADNPIVSTNKYRQDTFHERVKPLRTGSGEIQIEDIVIVNSKGQDTDSILYNEKVRVRVFFRVKSIPPDNAVLTLGITDASGNQIIHFNSSQHGIYVSVAPINSPQMIEFEFDNQLCPGEYGLISGIGVLSPHPTQYGKRKIDSLLDYCAGGSRFSVISPCNPVNDDLWGIFHVNFQARMIALD